MSSSLRDSDSPDQYDEDGPEAQKLQFLMGLRARGIRDARVLAAMERVPRQDFLSFAFAPQAYEDTALPIECGQTISQPYIVAYMTERLGVEAGTKVLEIGTGSGYQAAVLSHLCRRVYTIERHKPLLKQAEARFQALDLHNITTLWGDGLKGWPEQAPFERIMVTAAGHDVPQLLADQLAVGGKMLVPVGHHGDQMIVEVVRTEQGFETDHLLDVRFVPLVEGAAR
ncbi:MAG: protein-L-isoaspartate(D-aspartate) O-methyltransferase [Alphaproteobacteria bacterium]